MIFGEVLINKVSLILIKSDLVAMSLILIRKCSRRSKIKKSSLKKVDWKIEVRLDFKKSALIFLKVLDEIKNKKA